MSATIRALLALVLLVPPCAGPIALAQAPGRGGGLVPAPGLTREELVRQWDLDGNGTIDEAEATAARTRMRRARAELEQEAAIDPVTGRFKQAAEEAPADPPAAEAPTKPGGSQPRNRSTGPAPPRSRAPDVRLDAPAAEGQATPEPKRAAPFAGLRSPDRTGVPSQRPRTSGPTALTGGARAGAPAAVPGYGAPGPQPDLNAGRRLAEDRALRPPIGPRGGFLPATVRPAGPRDPRATQPAAPAPPRATAEEIGGY